MDAPKSFPARHGLVDLLLEDLLAGSDLEREKINLHAALPEPQTLISEAVHAHIAKNLETQILKCQRPKSVARQQTLLHLASAVRGFRV